MNISNFEKPLIIAHRGYKEKYPENTISAFDSAIDNGALMIELDICLTKDRKIVVIHDETLERTTNGNGLVNDYSLSELKELDAGSWFSPEFKNEKISTLTEILEKYSQKTMINIEIKPEAYEKDNPLDSIENQIIKLLQKFNCIDSVVISSFEAKIIKRISQMTVKPLLSFLTETPADSSIVDFIKINNIFSWNADYKILTKKQITMMHENGIKVLAYTVNDLSEAKRLYKMGVNGIFTDDIALMMNS